ncbi:MAG: Na(+)-translocating NADH-quinone reductase subunit C [Alphaproteobacteria bacterium]|nr:Na(+)-translocating NADH-quinone reductase subunit C [Alphaproteobacteria bacterium SS10]
MPDDNQNPEGNSEKPKGPIGRFLALPPDSVPKTFAVALTLCLIASMAVSAVAVALRPMQQENAARDKQVNILQVAGTYSPDIDVQDAFAAFEPKVLELETGEFTDQFDPTNFDDLAAADDPATSIALTDDPASIGRQSKFVTVYLLRDDAGDLSKVVLPIHGYGLWSTLYGFIALEANGNDIFGLQFYQHAETPGLGGEVDNPRWKALWRGKRLKDDAGELQITVAKTVPPAGADYHVDALSGSTLTSNGVDNMVRFWMGEQGYEPFLAKLKAGSI